MFTISIIYKSDYKNLLKYCASNSFQISEKVTKNNVVLPLFTERKITIDFMIGYLSVI